MKRTLQHALFMQAVTGVCPVEVFETISGWKQYSVNIALLPPNQSGKIDKLADLIVTSFTQVGCAPLRKVKIVGHADKDWHGEQAEHSISLDRAFAVKDELTAKVIQLWEDRHMGPPPPGGVEWEIPKGMGSTHMIAPPYHSENRRVEVTLTPFGAPVPIPDTLARRVARLSKLLETRRLPSDKTGNPTKRARCLMDKMGKPVDLDLYVNGMKSGEQIGKYWVPSGTSLCGWTGNYDPPPISQSDLNKFCGTVSSFIMSSGFAPTNDDAAVLQGLEGLIQQIDEGIIQVERYITNQRDPAGNYIGDNTRGQRLSSIFADHLTDENSIYSCWKGFHGND